MPFTTYPAVDENNNFPAEILQAVANSSQIKAAAKDAAVANGWGKTVVTSSVGQDADTYRSSGYYGIATLGVLNLPVDTQGVLEVFVFGELIIQRFTTWEGVPQRTFIRRLAGGLWNSWNETALETRLDAVESQNTSQDNEITNIKSLNSAQSSDIQDLKDTHYLKPQVGTGVDFNTITEPGWYPNIQGSAPNQPSSSLGLLEVLPMATGLVQRYTTWESTPHVYQRRMTSSYWNDWEVMSLRLGEASSATDLDAMKTPGHLGVNSINRPGQPVPIPGHLEVFRLGSVGVIQRFTTFDVPVRMFQRRGWTNDNGWAAWEEFPNKTTMDSAIANVNATISTLSKSSQSGNKIVPLAITQPGGFFVRQMATGAARWVRRYKHAPSRVRLHVSNRNPAGPSGGGAINLVGARIGVGTSTGNITSQIEAIAPNTAMPISGTDELVGPWLDVATQDEGYIGITLAWDGATGDQHMLYGGGWTIDNSTAGWDSETIDAAFVRSQGSTPFYVWLEAEVPARVSLVGGMGDSITVGTGTTDPVGEGAWLHLYAFAENALPVFFAQHGSTSASWGVDNHRWTGYYPGVDVTLDAMVKAIGRNDIVAGITETQMRDKDISVANAIRKVWPDTPQFIASITPYSAEDAAAGDVRRAHNIYRATLPNGERGFFDFADAVGTTDNTALEPAYSADGLHPNAAGQQQMSSEIVARPVTPYVLTEAKLRLL